MRRQLIATAICALLAVSACSRAGVDEPPTSATGPTTGDTKVDPSPSSEALVEEMTTSREGSCAETATEQNLLAKPEAFDATVVDVQRGAYDEEAAAIPLMVTLRVNQWFKQAVDDEGSEEILRAAWEHGRPDSTPGEVSSPSVIVPGVRLLAATDGRILPSWQVEDCGFAVPYSADAAEEWRSLFGKSP